MSRVINFKDIDTLELLQYVYPFEIGEVNCNFNKISYCDTFFDGKTKFTLTLANNHRISGLIEKTESDFLVESKTKYYLVVDEKVNELVDFTQFKQMHSEIIASLTLNQLMKLEVEDYLYYFQHTFKDAIQEIVAYTIFDKDFNICGHITSIEQIVQSESNTRNVTVNLLDDYKLLYCPNCKSHINIKYLPKISYKTLTRNHYENVEVEEGMIKCPICRELISFPEWAYTELVNYADDNDLDGEEDPFANTQGFQGFNDSFFGGTNFGMENLFGTDLNVFGNGSNIFGTDFNFDDKD